MADAVDSIAFGWDVHPDATYAGAGGVIVPRLSVRLPVHDAHVFFRADLNPSAALCVLPLAAAFEVPDLVPYDLDVVTDPVLRHLKLRLWKGRQKMEVYGDDLRACLSLRMRVAFDESGTLGTAILGQDFFERTVVVLDRQGLSSATRSSST